jgi:hypothetical protein
VARLRKAVPNLTILWDNKHYYLVKLQSSAPRLSPAPSDSLMKR